jgi:hypothetical protein
MFHSALTYHYLNAEKPHIELVAKTPAKICQARADLAMNERVM